MVGIRLQLSAAFAVVSLAIAAFVIGAITMQVGAMKRSALVEAEHFARLVAYTGPGNALSKPEYLQNYVDGLHALQGRDIVFVDSNKRGIADADKQSVGEVFNEGPGNEVGQTILDGVVRTFIERDQQHPQGIKQIVVPLRVNQADSESAIVGAAIVEYTQVYDRLLVSAETRNLYLLGAAGIGCVLLTMIFGFRIAARMAGRIKSLQDGVDIIAEGKYETRVSITSRDEVGRLGRAFNTMAEALTRNRDELVEYGRTLEARVASRTGDLTRANMQLRLEADERVKAVGALTESEERYRQLVELSPDAICIEIGGESGIRQSRVRRAVRCRRQCGHHWQTGYRFHSPEFSGGRR